MNLLNKVGLTYLCSRLKNIMAVNKADIMADVTALLEAERLNVYPIGSVYTSLASTSPASLFGGTWERLQNCFLYGAGTLTAGTTGGESTHTLTENEMPSHAGHVEHSSNGTNSKYLSLNNLSSYGSTPRGWLDEWGGEAFPYNKPLGGGASHNNMPPYLVAYMWKRTS